MRSNTEVALRVMGRARRRMAEPALDPIRAMNYRRATRPCRCRGCVDNYDEWGNCRGLRCTAEYRCAGCGVSMGRIKRVGDAYEYPAFQCDPCWAQWYYGYVWGLGKFIEALLGPDTVQGFGNTETPHYGESWIDEWRRLRHGVRR